MKYDETGQGMDRNFLRFGSSLVIEGSCSLSKLGSSVFRSTVYTYETSNYASITALRSIRFDETKNIYGTIARHERRSINIDDPFLDSGYISSLRDRGVTRISETIFYRSISGEYETHDQIRRPVKRDRR